MKLVYRGNRYEHETIPMEMDKSSLSGVYRGRRYDLTYPRHIPVPQPVVDLQYRGVPYHRAANGVATPVELRKDQRQAAPAMQRKKVQQDQLEQVHRLYLMRRLEHRLEVAQARGDQSLVNQLQKEMQQIA